MNLFYALGYKEWMKTRRMLGLAALVFVVVLAYTFIELTHDIRLEGAVNVWYEYLFQFASVAPLFVWLPLLAGVAVALAQFVPEMTNKRLKLTLHLPASETRIMVHMLFYGFGVLFLLFVAVEAVLALGMSCYLPSEVVSLLLLQLMPWTVSGLVAYGFTAWICIEPQWKQRAWNALVSVAGLAVFYVSLVPGTYQYFGWGMAGVWAASFLFPLYSCARFKNGIQ